MSAEMAACTLLWPIAQLSQLEHLAKLQKNLALGKAPKPEIQNRQNRHSSVARTILICVLTSPVALGLLEKL